MNAPTRSRVVYPEAPPIELDAPPRVWNRYRVVIPCFDGEQAERIAEKVSEICGCDVEQLWCMTDDEGKASMGEIVVCRKQVPVALEAPVEA